MIVPDGRLYICVTVALIVNELGEGLVRTSICSLVNPEGCDDELTRKDFCFEPDQHVLALKYARAKQAKNSMVSVLAGPQGHDRACT